MAIVTKNRVIQVKLYPKIDILGEKVNESKCDENDFEGRNFFPKNTFSL